jgi:hypothetical protein
MRRFANVKVIELKNVNTGRVSLLTANPTLATEQLTVIVFNKYTAFVRLGEEVEIVGDFYVLGSGLAASRYGSGGGGRHINIRTAGGENNYRAQPVLYADKMKYTKRQQQLELTATDKEILRRLAANTKSKVAATGRQKGCDLVSVLTNLFCPRIYDKTEGKIAKLALLLTCIAAAPKHEKQKLLW